MLNNFKVNKNRTSLLTTHYNSIAIVRYKNTYKLFKLLDDFV